MLLDFARSSLRNLEELEEKLRTPGDRLAGHLKIGTYESLAQYLWPEFLAAFRKTTPQTRVSIVTETGHDPSKSLVDGSIDVLVDAQPILSPRAFDRAGKGIERHLQEKGLSYGGKMELDSFTSVQAFALAGLGIAVLPTRLAMDSVRSKKLIEVTPEGFSPKGFGQHGIAFTVSSARVDDAKIKNLLKALRAWFQ